MGRENVFNLRIVGIGGKGIVRITSEIAEAALNEGIKFTVVERPRSAMRLGPITCDMVFGQENFSPFIAAGDADAVFSCEPLDGAMNAAYYLKKDGVVIMNSAGTESIVEIVTGEKDKRYDECLQKVKDFGCRVILEDAVQVSTNEIGSELGANYYLLGILFAVCDRLPVGVEAMRNVLSKAPQYLKCFDKGYQYS